MPDDLPPISQDLNDPLPQVDPNSQFVPYRLSNAQGGVTTGYGPRARPPIQPPDGFGGGVGMPNLDQIYQAAFSKLPVDEAVKATEAATRYIGLRGYQKALSSGEPVEKALSVWGPMILKSGVGIHEVLQAQMQRQKLAQPSLREAAGGLYRVPLTGPAEQLVAPKPVPPKLHFNNTTGEIVQENPDGTFKVARPGTEKATAEAGPVQSQPVLDPDTKEPIEGLIATPSPSGKGMTVRLTPKAEATLTPSVAAKYFEDAPAIDRKMGISPDAPGSFTRQMATNMVQIAARTPSKKKPATNPAQTRVKVKNKEGKVGTIPSDQLDKALEAGFTEVK